MAKLTLNVDSVVVARAKRFAASRGTSISRLVERFLAAISRARSAGGPDEVPPVLERLRAELRGKNVKESDYRDYLERKYT